MWHKAVLQEKKHLAKNALESIRKPMLNLRSSSDRAPRYDDGKLARKIPNCALPPSAKCISRKKRTEKNMTHLRKGAIFSSPFLESQVAEFSLARSFRVLPLYENRHEGYILMQKSASSVKIFLPPDPSRSFSFLSFPVSSPRFLTDYFYGCLTTHPGYVGSCSKRV